MAAVASSSSSSSDLQAALAARGWCLRDTDRIRELITASATVDSLESELFNMDLRLFGGKCLPQPSLLSKTSHLQGPIVLQVYYFPTNVALSIVELSKLEILRTMLSRILK